MTLETAARVVSVKSAKLIDSARRDSDAMPFTSS